MTIDEAIDRYSHNAEYERTHGNLQGYLGFRQLAEWLKDYKRLKEQEPTVKAIPLGKVEQIKEEIGHAMDMEPAWKGQNNYVGGLEIALSIIDKVLKEQSE